MRVFLAALVLAAALFDLRERRIPNWLVAAGLVGGFAGNIATQGWSGVKLASLGVGVAALVYVPLFLIRAMGAGDVKLMAAAGSIVGSANWLVIFVFAALFGGVAALVILLARGRLGGAFRNVGHIVYSLARLRAPWHGREDLDVASPRALTLPHGLAIAAGTLLYLAGTL